MTAKFTINGTFKITGRGLVLSGLIKEGIICPGDFVEFKAFDKERKRKITGVGSIRSSMPDKFNTGLMIKCEDDKEIDELRTWKPNGDEGIILKE